MKNLDILRSLVLPILKPVLVALIGALGTLMATSVPVYHAALCGVA